MEEEEHPVPPMSDMPQAAEIQKRRGAYLPHWTVHGGSYFVTFRLAGSLPASLIKEIDCLRADIRNTAQRGKRLLTDSEEEVLEELHFKTLDILEHDRKNRILEQDQIAEIVANALMHFDGDRYRLFCWTIMPNHVHVVFQPIGTWQLAQILHSWKSFTANAANKALDRRGSFWQAESYDHLIRNQKDLVRCVEYTWSNPEKAGLMDWRWRWKTPSEILLD